MRRATFAAFSLILVAGVAAPDRAAAFGNDDPARGSCAACHALTREEAASLLQGIADNVTGVGPGPFQGTWEVDASIGGKVYPLYMDYSKKYMVQGQVIRVRDGENISRLRFSDLNRVDVSTIPLKDAIVLGNPSSKRRIIVLTDPSCPYCVRLHEAIKEAVRKDPEAAFFIMPYPRNPGDRFTYQRSLAAVCDKTGKTLDDAFAGKKVPPPTGLSDAVDETIRLAERLRTQGTPSMILPDGRIVTGAMGADALLALTR
jgi:thiol:disulfide interchange protein DsbC